MRGTIQAQPDFLTVINLNQCVPSDHPLRAIKVQVDAVLKKLSPLFAQLYAEDGRASIPPEPRLKGARADRALHRPQRTPLLRTARRQSALALVPEPRVWRRQL